MARQSDRSTGRPRRRKKNQASKSRRLYWIAGAAAAGAIAVVALVILAWFMLRPRFGPPDKLTAPEQFVVYNASEEVFHVSVPKEWKLDSGGRKNAYWVSAERGGAKIKVYESFTGSLLGDIAGAGHADPNARDELLPVSRVHEMKKRTIADDYSDYREEPAVTVETKFGKVRRSAFTAKAGLSEKVRGYRATALGSNTQISVLCTCAPGDWDTLEPAFARVIASIGPGPGGG